MHLNRINVLAPTLDHLVVAATTLDAGVKWCEETLGVTPLPGGSHPLFGTHNRLLPLISPSHPLVYLEIIAIDPSIPPNEALRRPRWFDLDDPSIQMQLRDHGPQLLHWVARVPDLSAAIDTWAKLGISRGPIIEASRPTPNGVLRWKISVREDGQRLFDGILPTLIEWGKDHPRKALIGPTFSLKSFTLAHPQHELIHRALRAIDLRHINLRSGPPQILAELVTPEGRPNNVVYQAAP
ncbi:MAG: VOC family protein [Burkholderiaceae bacterium]